MTRYFFYCPLKAAWMAKKFGMRFLYGSSTKATASVTSALTITRPNNPAVIHPDSLHLLEPKVGDLVKVNAPDDFFYTHVTTLYEHDNVGIANGWVTRRNIIERGDIDRVIQRNGVAFHWPESEVA